MPGPTPDPFDRVRDEFASLGTSEKAAFVLEATFSTIGQALAETGRRAAETIESLNIDAWFTAPPASHGAPPPPEPPPMAATPADIEKTAARPDAPSAETPPPKKTPGASDAPRRRPPSDDES